MKGKQKILRDRYVDIDYRMFDKTNLMKLAMKVAGILSLPFVYPLVIISKLSSETGFRTASELISIIPFAIGIIVRFEFYRRALRACGENVFISFGTIFYYPEITIGNDILIGMYNTIHHCDFGSNVMTAEGCRFLSGKKYHSYDRTDVPMTMQGGQMKRIRVGDDVWVGANAVVMEEVCRGSIVGAGSVVINKIEPFSVVAGNPASVIKKRN